MKLISLVLVAGLFLPLMIEITKAQESSEDYSIKHLKTIKMIYGTNYYSYNFVVFPGEKTIDSMKIEIISDIETKYAFTENDISEPYWISFGMMIHAQDPESIKTKVIEIEIKN